PYDAAGLSDNPYLRELSRDSRRRFTQPVNYNPYSASGPISHEQMLGHIAYWRKKHRIMKHLKRHDFLMNPPSRFKWRKCETTRSYRRRRGYRRSSSSSSSSSWARSARRKRRRGRPSRLYIVKQSALQRYTRNGRTKHFVLNPDDL